MNEVQKELDGIAVIGMAGRFPGAKSTDQFWRNLAGGVESIQFFCDEELIAAGVSRELLQDPSYVKAGAVLEDVELFDAAFFGINPLEAEVIDPQHRVFLEISWEALEQAGYHSETYSGLISVFGSTGLNRYLLHNVLPHHERIATTLGEHPMFIGNDKDFMPMRVSYKMNLRGGSVNVQSACSSSIVAIHLACQSLLNGECDMALAGGSAIAVPHRTGYVQQQGITSADGHCRAFDAESTGTIFGSGAGVVVLKRLEDAVADGDQIYAVVRGSAVNNDGTNKVSFTAPSVNAQSEVIAEAIALADVEPSTIRYVETHGTGTPLGDPIEIAALTEVFSENTDEKGFCAIGSVKTNVGHLDVASGVTGFIKSVLSLYHKQIPPSLHYQAPNPKIDFANSPFYVNTELTAWPSGATPRRAGVSSFGFGGTNAHAVLEEAPEREPSSPSREWQLLLLSAKTDTALEAAADNLQHHLCEQKDLKLPDVAYTLQIGRQPFEHRRVLVARDGEEAVELLASRDPKRVWTGRHDLDAGGKSVRFLFPGTGSQYLHMARDLYETEPLFQEKVDECCEILQPLLGVDLLDVIDPRAGAGQAEIDRLNRTEFAQPALFVIEYALAELLIGWGIEPQGMIGHSLGEYVAACIAGVFSLEDALLLVAKRAQMIQSLPDGAMLAVHLPEAEVHSLLAADLSLAVVNGESHCVVAGSPEAVKQLEAELLAREVSCARVHTVSAFHSHLVESILADFTALVGTLDLQAPEIPFVSNVTGTWITAEEATDPAYWARHLRQTVRFAEGVRELSRDPFAVLVEVGPGKTLSSFARQIKQEDGAVRPVVTTMRHVKESQSDQEVLLTALGKLWLSGIAVDWEALYEDERRHRVPLPTYPFERQRYWLEAVPDQSAVLAKKTAYQETSADPVDWFYASLWKQSQGIAPFSSELFASERRSILVFADSTELSASILVRLSTLGQDVTAVQIGELQTADDYQALVRRLQEQERTPDTVLHLWGLTSVCETEEGERFQREQELGFYSLMYLARAFGVQGVTAPVKIWSVVSGLHELGSCDEIVPEKTTVLALGKVIQQEYSNLTCRTVDTLLPPAGSPQAQLLVEQLLAELQAEPTPRNIAYRGRNRYEETFEQVATADKVNEPTRLRQGGVYLITGGFGQIGSRIALYLAQQAQAKLVLVSRSASLDEQDPNSSRLRLVKELESLGAQVEIIAADVTDEDQLQEAVERAVQTFGALNGVFHAAGGTDERFVASISEIGPEHCELNFQTRVQAIYGLERVLRGRDLDFCLLISSLTSVLGGLGLAAYASSHNFMDAFVQKINGQLQTPWLTFQWDLKALDDVAEVMGRALSEHGPVPFVISKTNLHASIQHWVTFEAAEESTPSGAASGAGGYERPELLTEYVEPQDETEEVIAQFWRDLLGIERIGVHDNFFELGGNSLLATNLVRRLNKEFEVQLPLQTLFEATTVAELAAAVEDALIAQIIEQS